MASISKRGKNYLIQVSMPDGQGGYIRKSSTYTPPLGSTPTQAKRGADKYAIEFENKCRGLTNYNENMTLDELQAWYMADIAPNRIKARTAELNTRTYNLHIQPLLGRYKLKQLTPVVIDNAFKQIWTSSSALEYYTLTDVEAFKDALFAVGGSYRRMEFLGIIAANHAINLAKGGKTTKDKAQAIADYCKTPLESLFKPVARKPLNSGSIRKIKCILGVLLSAATKKGIISHNPMLNTETVKVTVTEQPVMTTEQARIFLARLEKLNNISVRALLVTALFTGMRSGELRALCWPDIDTQRGLINVNKSLDDMNRVTTPKTKSSVRYVQIDFRLVIFLDQYHSEQQAHINAMRGRVADNGIVFPNTSGKHMCSSNVNKTIKSLIRDTDIPQNLHIHSLRHCFTSILINNGADAKKVQTALGHSSVVTTQNIYGHIFAETLAETMQGVSLTLTNGNNIFGNET